MYRSVLSCLEALIENCLAGSGYHRPTPWDTSPLLPHANLSQRLSQRGRQLRGRSRHVPLSPRESRKYSTPLPHLIQSRIFHCLLIDIIDALIISQPCFPTLRADAVHIMLFHQCITFSSHDGSYDFGRRTPNRVDARLVVPRGAKCVSYCRAFSSLVGMLCHGPYTPQI